MSGISTRRSGAPLPVGATRPLPHAGAENGSGGPALLDAAFLNRQLVRLDLPASRVDDDGQLACDFLGFTLSSAFQSILSARDGSVHSHEALLRARDAAGQPVSPIALFERISGPEDGRRLDRAARLVHVGNFYRQTGAGSRLFLNVHGRHIETCDAAHGEFFAAALAEQSLGAEGITIEILESSIEDFEALGAAVESYKAFGFRVAIDDFGTRHSNFDRVWRLDPDYVKIDRSLVLAAATDRRARIVLPKIIEIVHDLGALVVCEGIEDDVHARVAVDSGADFLQGYLFGRPAAVIETTAGYGR
jgi:EAL domain-containing protein (putative c-di-GMP-specific phosphodiesterase class I)